jgi:hypothetical protein
MNLIFQAAVANNVAATDIENYPGIVDQSRTRIKFECISVIKISSALNVVLSIKITYEYFTRTVVRRQ